MARFVPASRPLRRAFILMTGLGLLSTLAFAATRPDAKGPSACCCPPGVAGGPACCCK